MRRLIGSHCSCLRIGVMWSRRGVKVNILALRLELVRAYQTVEDYLLVIM